MNRRLPFLLAAALASAAAAWGGRANFDLEAPPHRYSQRVPQDRFTQLKAELEAGRVTFDESSELAYLRSLLDHLKIPVSSQMLVFSTTSLQLRLIRQDNPRALYFTDDLYVGYIPGGRIEIVSIDPELGGIFYIFDIPRPGQAPVVERSERCMRCHSDDDTGGVPGLVVKSVMPGPTGGSLDAYRQEQTGHGIPWEERFGGWYVTGRSAITNHLGNSFGRYVGGELTAVRIDPNTRFDASRYLLPTSDILPQLLHEHQAGFVNRVVLAGYHARSALHHSEGRFTAPQAADLDEQASQVTRYLLFADEVRLPAGGVEGDAAYKEDFLKGRPTGPAGASLKDLDLQTRLFRYRCSYMIYSSLFQGLPGAMKQRIYERLSAALSTDRPHPEYAYLPAEEKRAIHGILKATLPELPTGF